MLVYNYHEVNKLFRNVTEKLNLIFRTVENNVGKGENADYQHFLLLPQCFHKVYFFRVVKSRDCVVKS